VTVKGDNGGELIDERKPNKRCNIDGRGVDSARLVVRTGIFGFFVDCTDRFGVRE
jgi:hypothetical protein